MSGTTPSSRISRWSDPSLDEEVTQLEVLVIVGPRGRIENDGFGGDPGFFVPLDSVKILQARHIEIATDQQYRLPAHRREYTKRKLANDLANELVEILEPPTTLEPPTLS